MALALFAGIPVSEFESARSWYEQLLGEISFLPHETEAVWELAENRSVFINQDPERAGNATQTVFLENLGAMVEEIRGRGLQPDRSETYANGVRKVTYRDPDGNEFGFGGLS